jgi:hypothetical protein
MGEYVTAEAGVAEGVGWVETATVSMRGYFSTQHLWSAEHSTRLAAELEAAHTGEARFSIRHRSYVLGAVGEAVAFLEAFINELFQDAQDATKTVPDPGAAMGVRGLSDDVVRLLAAYWNSTDEGERVRALDKYDAARLFAGCPREDRGRLEPSSRPDGRRVDFCHRVCHRTRVNRVQSMHTRQLLMQRDQRDAAQLVRRSTTCMAKVAELFSR